MCSWARMPSEPGQAAAAEQWASLSDELLSGLVHALNNRVTALSVCAELASLGDEQMVKDGVLMSELSRLQRASALIGLLPARPHQAEALELRPVLDDAIELHASHPRMRMIRCEVAASGAIQPVRTPRWALLRLLLVLVDAAKEAVDGGAASHVPIRLTSDARSTSVRIMARGNGGLYGAAMAEECGGTLARDGRELVLTLPSLSEVRQRERDARAAE
jgi:C4-dicarboxylate-specific signal transduction histidine kinase